MNPMLSALHAVARISVEQMFYCVIEGTLLVFLTGLLLRILPRRNSGTRFVVWFAVLLSMLLLPFLGHAWNSATVASGQSGRVKPPLVISSAWIVSIFAVWAVIAAFALLRVLLGLWQIR